MKKPLLFAAALLGCLIIAAVALSHYFDPGPGRRNPEVLVLNELPATLERNNPVPEVRTWTEDGRTYYYFNWGVQSSGGYALEWAGLKGNLITVKAVAPKPDALVSQAFTYPSLLLSLPAGQYRWQAVNDQGKPLGDIFRATRPPLRFTLVLPGGLKRAVLRDPALNTEGKSKVQIALEALFSQDELIWMGDDLTLEGAAYSQAEGRWVVGLSREYDRLGAAAKEALRTSIADTIAAVSGRDAAATVLTGDLRQLPNR
jgi:hypothetical protein